jgi:hypothetical protein
MWADLRTRKLEEQEVDDRTVGPHFFAIRRPLYEKTVTVG